MGVLLLRLDVRLAFAVINSELCPPGTLEHRFVLSRLHTHISTRRYHPNRT
jgi:hypothetical protein